MSENLPQIGDVITSPKFAFGYWEHEDSPAITVDGETTKHSLTVIVGEGERVEIAAKTGQAPPKRRVVELGAYDPGRGTAEFVVEEARMQGGGTGHGPFDVYPDGWHVTARRLSEDGTYDPDGTLIRFYMTGCFTCMVRPDDVEIVRKMRRVFV